MVPVYAVGYREGALLRLTEDYKYKSIRKTAELLAEFLDEAVPKELGDEVVVVPLPTISKHIRERGFDHTLLLAKELAKRRGWRVEQILKRANKTVQVGADEETRKRQAASAYEVGESGKDGTEECVDKKKMYLLLDDVWTTGASMEAAIAVIKKAGAKKLAAAVILMSPD